jgi:glycosyltransferase involved in cell wall biosynthesis
MLLRDNEIREQLGKQAAVYASRFTWESTVDEFERQIEAELSGEAG